VGGSVVKRVLLQLWGGVTLAFLVAVIGGNTGVTGVGVCINDNVGVSERLGRVITGVLVYLNVLGTKQRSISDL
jgi:hypothetical protein